MTFLEKALEMETDKSLTKEDIIHNFCPSGYGLEDDKCNLVDRKGCKKCWNREMPNTEPKNELVRDFDCELDMAYEKGMNDAWELAKQILYGIDKQLIEIFDKKVEPRFFDLTHKRDIINCHTPQEAKAKMEKWRESKKIEVGDVVELTVGTKCVVTAIRNDIADGFTEVGYSFYDLPLDELKKTGKHIDIKAILEQIGE
jgi:hypothetical protein